jgi:hypothetical protein
MSNTKISALTAIDAVAAGDKVPVADASDLTATKSATAAQLSTYLLSTITSTAGVASSPSASGTVTITHGLGRTPTIIRTHAKSGFTSNAAATPTTSCDGIWNSSGNRCIYQSVNGTTTTVATLSTAFSIFMDTAVSNTISGVIQNVGATTFDIVFTEVGTHTRGVYMWEAQ